MPPVIQTIDIPVKISGCSLSRDVCKLFLKNSNLCADDTSTSRQIQMVSPERQECPDVKNYKRRLNAVWHKMLYRCTHMATVGVKEIASLGKT